MKIVVCIKQVPDTKGGFKFNPDGTLDRGAMLAIMNPDDKAGLEAALRIKDEIGAEVTVLTMGLPKAEEVLREAMAMGADNGFLVTDRVLGGADTWATSTTLAGALRNIDYDLIITGRQAIDGDTAQVGPQISEHLDIPVISYAQDIKVDGDYVIVHKTDGCFESGKICVVLINGDEATIKKVVKTEEGIELYAFNPYYPMKKYTFNEIKTLEIKIIGVVENQIRNWK